MFSNYTLWNIPASETPEALGRWAYPCNLVTKVSHLLALQGKEGPWGWGQGCLSLLHYYPGGILIVQTFCKYAIRSASDFRPFPKNCQLLDVHQLRFRKLSMQISGDNNIPDRLAKIVRLQYVLWSEHYKLRKADWRIWLLAVPGPLLRKGWELVFQMHGF